MPSKTDRILGYLPSTFKAFPRPTALYSVADAFGNELQRAENSLAAVMLAHWVDHADSGSEFIDDLARIASLYGLTPRPDESVEEFRDHLKRYIRIWLEGTATVQGVLRVVADALRLRIADRYTDMDTWWTRGDDVLVTGERRGDDAARLLFGFDAGSSVGQDAEPAHITGSVSLAGPLDLRGGSVLRIKVDNAAPVNVDLAQGVDPAAVTLDHMVTAINSALHAAVAGTQSGRLTLASPRLGPGSRLEVQEVDQDAAPLVLGLTPRTYRGTPATAARVVGTRDLSGGADLSDLRYVRLVLDRQQVLEVDCSRGAANPAQATLKDIAHAINDTAGATVAADDGQHLVLTSNRTGAGSSIAFARPAAQDATSLLFGDVPALTLGRDARPAIITGTRDLSGGVDLSGAARIRVRLDGRAAVTINCAGPDPAHTRPADIVAALNGGLGRPVASHDGKVVRLASPTSGPGGSLVFESLPPADDATEAIFGLNARGFQGRAATAARLAGAVDLGGNPIDLRGAHVVDVALDGGAPVAVDVAAKAADRGAASLDDIVAAFDAALGPGRASTDGQHLALASSTVGSASRLAVTPRQAVRRRRFVTRAFLAGEAAETLLGVLSADAAGAGATRAVVVGKADLSRGVDLRTARFLRLSVDGEPAHDIDLASMSAQIPRPRAALLNEIVAAINAGRPAAVASHDGTHLLLASPSAGSGSRLAFEAPQGADALATVLGLPPGAVTGQDATRVSFLGAADLGAGVDLPAGAAVALGIDGGPVVQVALTGDQPARRAPGLLVAAINGALAAQVAIVDGSRLRLTSGTVGAGSRIEFAVPAGVDATQAVFGIAAPRVYHGAAPAPARVVGRPDLSGGANLSVAHILHLGLDNRPAVEVDLAGGARDAGHVTLREMATAINTALGPQVAGDDGKHLIITSAGTGARGRIELLAYAGGDARLVLLGDVPAETVGTDAAAAVITGTPDLGGPVNLAERSVLRLAVDGGPMLDVDVAGARPDATSLDEIVAAINSVFSNLAVGTADGHLRLVSPAAGEASRLQVLPVRALEVIEYPPQTITEPPRQVRHGDTWAVKNDGAGSANATLLLTTPLGSAGPALLNGATGQRVRLMLATEPGDRIRLWRGPAGGLSAKISHAEGNSSDVPPASIIAGLAAAQAQLPMAGPWQLTGGDAGQAPSLQLDNPLAPAVLALRQRGAGPVSVTAADAAVSNLPGGIVAGRIEVYAGGYRLVNTPGGTPTRLVAVSGTTLDGHAGRIVLVTGQAAADQDGALLLVERIDDLFDVTLTGPGGQSESYPAVTIGGGVDAPRSLLAMLYGQPGSQLVSAWEVDKAGVLQLPRGRTDWTYLDCQGPRFDAAVFDGARYPGGDCAERGIFDISRFANTPPERGGAVFASAPPLTDPPVVVELEWPRYQPGLCTVNLPADLPAAYGARFDQARFGSPSDAAEAYHDVVTEPPGDPQHMVTLINGGSKLICARQATDEPVPLGFEAVPIPFARPRERLLQGGTPGERARLYLVENGVPGFVELSAAEPGDWGDAIAVTVTKSGPARFDMTVRYEGAVFENARQVALGQLIGAHGQDLFKPGPAGALQAKAGGVYLDVTRDLADGTS